MKHFNYLSYVLRHKWYVFLAGTKIRGCSWFLLLIHDLSKFRVSEWFPYVEKFYGEMKVYAYVDDDFDLAWLHHQHRNKHHWQYWILLEDDGDVKILDMPMRYTKEMVADWAGAGRAITGKWEVCEWYLKNAGIIKITRSTRREVENILRDSFDKYGLFNDAITPRATIKEL